MKVSEMKATDRIEEFKRGLLSEYLDQYTEAQAGKFTVTL